MVAVKICGNTEPELAVKIAQMGADYIGVIVEVPVNTPRKVTASKAREILRAVEYEASGVAVIMPTTIEEAVRLYNTVRPDYLQLHGNEPPAFVKQLRSLIPCNIIKTIHVGEDAIKKAKDHSKFSDAILLDTSSKEMGGSGETHDWEISRRIVEEVEKPVFLAGGLTPENVKDAIKVVRPYAVDVSSGVETEKGIKDLEKVKRFIEMARTE
jgi:phosphoribosylanthranilate isomerase